MKRVAGYGVAVLLAASVLAGCGGREGKVAAKVNNETITEDEFDKRVQGVSAVDLYPAIQGQPGPAKAGEFAMLHMILEKLAEQYGAQKGIKPTDSQISSYVAYAKKYQRNPPLTLMNPDPFRTEDDWKRDSRIALIQRGLALAPLKLTEADIQKKYDEIKPQLASEDQYHLRFIDIHAADKAKQAEDALSKGLSFETVALKFSDDPTSRAKMGDVGIVASGSVPPALLSVIKDFKAGEYTKHAVMLAPSTGVANPPAAAKAPHYVFAQVVEKLPGRTPSLQESRYVVEMVLLRDKDPGYLQRLQGDMEEFRKKSAASIQINLKPYDKLLEKLTSPTTPTATPGVPGGPSAGQAPPPGATAPTGR